MHHIRRRKLQPWPRPRESIAKQIETGTKHMSGSLAWVPKGPALETYETKIREDLEATLANAGLPEWETIFLKLYMVGRDEDSARPMVMVCCVHRHIRKMAEASIRESRILDRFTGFGLGSSALLLESHGLEELLTKRVNYPASRETLTLLTDFQGYQLQTSQAWSNKKSGEAASELRIYGSVPHRLGGTVRFVSMSHGEVSEVHTTTGGPIFQLDTELYQITSGHGMLFGASEPKVHYTTSELDECDFDGKLDFDDDIGTSAGSLTPGEMSAKTSDDDSHTSHSTSEEIPRAVHQTPAVQALHNKIHADKSPSPSDIARKSCMQSSDRLDLQFHNPDLDYVLLKLPTQSGMYDAKTTFNSARHETHTASRFSHIGTDDTHVLVLTPYGPIPGMISPQITSCKVHGSTKFQQLLMVQLDGVFRKGFSGSAVVDSVTGAVYGQIAIGTPGQSLGYCLRAPDIFASILSRLGHVPILDERQWQVNGQLSIRINPAPPNAHIFSMEMPDNATTSSYGENPMKLASRGRNSSVDDFGSLDLVERADCTSGSAPPARRTTSWLGRLRSLVDQVFMWIGLVYSRFWLNPCPVNTRPNDAATRRGETKNTTIEPANKTGARRRKRWGHDDDEEGSSEEVKKLGTRRSSRTFACPFYLYDRLEGHNCLRNHTLNRIADVRTHLLRSHSLPPQCPSCGEVFDEDSAGSGPDEDRFDEHVKLHTCQALPTPPRPRRGITRDQFDAVQKSARRGPGWHTKDPPAEKWFEIWDIIFPGTPRPVSPYLTEHPDVQRIRDMNDAIFSGHQWRDLTFSARGSSPTRQNVSRKTLMTIAEDFVELYRQIYQDQNRPGHEPADNDLVADTSVISSMDRSPQEHWARVHTVAPSDPLRAIQDPVPSGHPATATGTHDQWMIQQTRGYSSSHDRSPIDKMASSSTSSSSFAYDPGFLPDAVHLGPHHQLPSCQ